MATYTENYNLKKPSTTDQVNIEDLNGNADIIDAALAGKADTADVSGKYTKPETGIPASDLTADVQASLGKADTAVQATEKGATNGVATLDGAGKVPSSQLPSYVDDVIEGYYYNGAFYNDSAHTAPITAETGKIYVDINSNKSYRYSGSAFYRIDEVTVDATPTAGSSNPVSSGGTYSALAGKVDKETGKALSTNDYTTAEKNKLDALPTNTELQTAFDNKQNILTFDDAPTQNSTNPVTSGGVFAALKDVDNSEEMTIAQYNALSEEKKMDGTVRFITDVSVWPDAAGVGF